ncbi:MAG: hypothetical protein RQ864_01130 [Lutibacter sp.]|nr:hypothetical protein [Lutibacter sp.]
MEQIKTQHELRAAILRLEIKQAEEGKALKEEFKTAYNSFKPANIIVNTLKDLGDSNFVKDSFLNTSVGLGTGYLSKILFQGVVKSPLKKLIGSALMFGITNVVAKNPDAIKAMAKKIFNLFGKRTTEEVNETGNSDTYE